METSNTNHSNDLEVALLIDDLTQAKKISNVFREIGVVPHFYQDLRSFWNGVLKNTPALSIVDVKLMSGDGLSVLQHPLVKQRKLPLSFFYEDKNKPLLISTFTTFHYGLISAALPMKGQIKSILTRLNEFFELQWELNEGQKNLNLMESKINSLVNGYQSEKENQHFYQYLQEICYNFENSLKANSFNEACESVFNQVEDVKEFAIFELNEKAQRLISPQLIGGKFHKLPSLWLGQTSEEGIEFFAQNQASQVALDLMGGNIVTLYIYGARRNPELILYITSDNEEFLNQFNWQFMEKVFSGLYAKKTLETNILNRELEKPLMAPWELFSFINEQRIKNAGGDYALIDLDFSILVDLVSNQTNFLFHWKNLYREFMNSLMNRSKIDFHASAVGPRNICFVVKQSLADDFFQMVKMYSSKYPYWRYFEETENYFTTNLKPRIQMIPFSTKAYVEYIDNFVVDEKLGISERKANKALAARTPQIQI